MKYLIVGLGNMHPDYDGTRHNVGFEVLDLLASEKGASFKNDSLGDIALVKHKSRHIHLLKPSTYMNLSGKAVRYWMQKHKVKIENVLIVVDDINIDFGKLRLRSKGAHGGHNGLKDVERMLGTSKYARLRVGIGSDFSKGRRIMSAMLPLMRVLEQGGKFVQCIKHGLTLRGIAAGPPRKPLHPLNEDEKHKHEAGC